MSERMAYRIAEVAALIGLDTETVRRLCVSGDLPARKVGKVWLIPAGGLEGWLYDGNDGRARQGNHPAGGERAMARGRDDGRRATRVPARADRRGGRGDAAGAHRMAALAERAAIRAEKPLHNITHLRPAREHPQAVKRRHGSGGIVQIQDGRWRVSLKAGTFYRQWTFRDEAGARLVLAAIEYRAAGASARQTALDIIAAGPGWPEVPVPISVPAESA